MRFCMLVTLAFLAFSLSGHMTALADQPTSDLNEQFKNPGPEYRGAPFLSLNDDLDGDELVRQIRGMKEQGMGGFFLHSRAGLITPYMGEKWLDLIERCADEAKATGTYAWLYDEDRWPSGFAGGMVPAKGAEYRQKFLNIVEFDLGKDTKVEERDGQITVNGHTNVITWFACRKVDGKIEDLRQIPVGVDTGLPEGTRILLFRKEVHGDSHWFNGYAYVDTLRPEVIRAFIESTYEPYWRKLGGRFGKEIPGIFTDEPNIGAMAWTERLPEEFVKRCGYDLLEHLPSLFHEVGNWRKVRHDYRSLTADMYLEAFSKQIYEWCDARKLQFTGHYLAEDTLVSQLKRAGACMPHYEYMHMPGIDHLMRTLQGITLVKQVSSAANQLGKKRVLSETFGGGGWNTSFADQKWIANWQYALGVNFTNQHLSLYSARGSRKRDWPPSYYQQPYWKHYRVMNDYLARVCLMLTRGDFLADVLVIHPIASAWCVYSPHDESKARALADAFKRTSTNLAQLHREFEYGDEKLMAKYAEVQGKELAVGRMKYRAVVVPPSVTLAGTTFKLLREFLDAGGTVIAIKPIPTLVDGEDSAELARFFEEKRRNLAVIEEDKAQLDAALQAAVPRGLSVTDESGAEAGQVICHRRQDGKRHIVFLASTDLHNGCDVTLTLEKRGRVEDWDLEKGSVGEIPARKQGSGMAISVSLPGAGSRLLVIDESAKFAPMNAAQPMEIGSLELSDAWEVRRHDPNSILLDLCSYRIADGEWKGPVPVFKVQREMEGRPDGTEVTLRFSFDIVFEPSAGEPMFLVLEQPEIHTIRLNGQAIEFKDAGRWVDKHFRKVDISRDVRSGNNIIELSCKFIRPKKPKTLVFVEGGVELENVYIVGDFGVAADSTKPDGPMGTTVADGGFKLVNEAATPIAGDLAAAGYPFFAGDIELAQSVTIDQLPGGRAYLELDGLDAIVAKVRVNGRDAGLICWGPYRVDITDHLKKGRNRIQVVLTNSLRNLLGPHHHKGGELHAASPGSFVDEGNWTDAYHFVKLGIPGKARIRWEK